MPATILIVEDDSALSDAFSMILEWAGYEAAVADNGKSALKYLDSHSAPSLILLDILMPVMGGKEFLEKFSNTKNIPIVVLSNLDSKRDIDELLALGASNYILKSSIDPASLTAMVASTIATISK